MILDFRGYKEFSISEINFSNFETIVNIFIFIFPYIIIIYFKTNSPHLKKMNIIGFLGLTIYFLLVNIGIYLLLEKELDKINQFRSGLFLFIAPNLYWFVDLFFDSDTFLVLVFFSLAIIIFHTGFNFMLFILKKMSSNYSPLYDFILVMRKSGIYVFTFSIQVITLAKYFFN